ncbi:serine/threonine-protein phosphatase 4 regulatory subunit 2-A-like [Gigantopelta aegis]|uniref:serine/threonine-protein phosphatase 4 regulatory subunit 2-A-like n=1 Tax=Gigantopelta aegis TaxID=1735272 RepID=UPI001B88CEBB|nr:serine/threonine-protein phosphatase 4 regulatory subunit 2-A-like [Gigantopelta aegis]
MVRSMGSMTTMDNQEEILDALNDFEKKPSQEIPPVLEQFLQRIAKTGETLFPWPRLKPLLVSKLDEVMKHFNQEVPGDHFSMCPNVENVRYDDMRSRILSSLDAFHGAPFTIQRLCELITNPKRHYNRSDKFLRGIEKNVLVVSTVDPFGRKIVSESRNLVNGLDTNGQVELRDGVSGSSRPPLWASKNTVGVWPFHPEGAHNSTMVCPLEISTATDKDSGLHEEPMDSTVSTVQDSNEILQHTEDITNSPALHPVQEAVVETSLAQPGPDLMNSSVEEITSEAAVEIHSVLVENCAIPESLPVSNFSTNTVVTSNVGKDSFATEVTSDGSLTVTSQGVCDTVLSASNTVSVVTSDTVQECVLSSQSYDGGTSSEVVLDSTVNNLSSEHVRVENVSHVSEGDSQQQTVTETVGRTDLCVGSSDLQEASLHDSSEVEISTCSSVVSSSETVTKEPQDSPAVIQPTSSTGHLADEPQSGVAADEAQKLVDKDTGSGNDAEGICSPDGVENTSSASVEVVTSGSSQSDVCHASLTKPDSTLTADSVSTADCSVAKPDTSDSKAIDTDKTDSGDCEGRVDVGKPDSDGSDECVKTNSGEMPVTDKPESGDSESTAGTDKLESGDREALTNNPNSGVGDEMAVPSSCESDRDVSLDCSSTVEEVSHAKDTSGESVTPNTQEEEDKPAAATVTEIMSVETTIKTDSSVSDNTANMESVQDQTSTRSVEPMEQD